MGTLRRRLEELESQSPKRDTDDEWKVVLNRVCDAISVRPELQGDPLRFEQISPYCSRAINEPRVSADERRRAWAKRIIKGEGTAVDNRIFADVSDCWCDVPGWDTTMMDILEIVAMSVEESIDAIEALKAAIALEAKHGKS